MRFRRGDIALAFYPFAAGTGGSRRPVLIVQSDDYNRRIRNVIVAQITSTLTRAGDPTHVVIDRATIEGQESGLLHTSVVSCLNLATLRDDRIDRVIGRLSDTRMHEVDRSLQTALGLS